MTGDSKEELFEEFQFRPLTEGLGFHKKSTELKKEVDASGLLDLGETRSIPTLSENLLDEVPEIAESVADLTPPKVKAENPVEAEYLESIGRQSARSTIQQPLPREEVPQPKPDVEKAMERVTPQLDITFKESEVAKTSLSKDVLKETNIEPRFEMIASNMTSAVFDAVVAFTLAILFLVAMVSVTKVDLVALVFNAKTQLAIQGSLVLMYIAILQLYMIIARVIAGSTLGEWAFDVHVAERGDRRSMYYPLKIVLRSVLSVATGFVVLPILSMIVRRDLVGVLSGTRLYQQV
jgi:hypothetical protein